MPSGPGAVFVLPPQSAQEATHQPLVQENPQHLLLISQNFADVFLLFPLFSPPQPSTKCRRTFQRSRGRGDRAAKPQSRRCKTPEWMFKRRAAALGGITAIVRLRDDVTQGVFLQNGSSAVRDWTLSLSAGLGDDPRTSRDFSLQTYTHRLHFCDRTGLKGMFSFLYGVWTRDCIRVIGGNCQPPSICQACFVCPQKTEC